MGEVSLSWNTWKALQGPSSRLLYWGLVFISLSISGFVCEDVPPPPPNPEKEIQITHKVVGDSSIMTCKVKDLGRRRIIWSRLSDPYPISIGTTRFHPNQDKYRVANQLNSNVLTIRKLSMEDAGEYQCRVSGSFPLKEVISLNIQSDRHSTYFKTSDRSVTAAPGETVILPCKVENLNDRMVLWKDDNNNVISLRKRIYNGDSRLHILHDTRPDWHLKIDEVKKEDFGFYTCVVNSEPVLTRTVQLISNEPPKVAPVLKRDTNFRKKIEVMAGDTVTLTCNFHSYPPATVKWYKRYQENNKTRKNYLGATGSEYTIRSISASQAGDYVCIARNGMVQEGKARTRLTVKVPPTTVATTVATTTFIPTGPVTPHIYHEELRKGQRRGRDLELTCFAIGQPRPNIHWSRHGQRIINDHKYKMKTVSRGRYTTHSTLLIRSMSSRDFGTYKCSGYNQLGLNHILVEAYELKD